MLRGKAGANLPGLESCLQDLGMSINYSDTQVSVGKIHLMRGGNPVVIFSYLTGSYTEMGARFFFEVCCERTKTYIRKHLQKNPQSEIKKKNSSQ